MVERKQRFVLCIESGSYQGSLEPRKIYRIVEDPAAEARRLLRVVDESGEDYLFPAEFFVPIEVPEKAVPAFATTTPSAQ
jgi:hypothetical protein